jgi:hypothetical protein
MSSTTFSGPVTSNNGFVGAVDASGTTLEAPQALVAALPSAATVGRLLVVTNANSGAGTVCFSDGTDWIDISTGVAVVA